MKMKILEIISKNSEEEVEPNDLINDCLLSELGIDSLKFMITILEIELAIGTKITNFDKLPCVKTVGNLVNLIMEEKIC